MYKKADAIINFDDKFAIVQKHSLDLYVLVGNKMQPIFNQVFFMYDSVLKRITAFINVAFDKQEKIIKYVNETYSCVTIQAKEQWLRLDFDKDETVSVDDLKNSMYTLYEFLKNYSVLDEMSFIKCKLYSQAIEYMKAELQDKKKQNKRSSSKQNTKQGSASAKLELNCEKMDMNEMKVSMVQKGKNGDENKDTNGKYEMPTKESSSDDVKE